MSLIHASETVIYLIWRSTDVTYTITISTSGDSVQGNNLYHNFHDTLISGLHNRSLFAM